MKTIDETLKGNSYPGRGIIVGKSADGKHAMIAYFIMGRSENSRNRIFTEKHASVYTEPFDENKVEDPSLIIYRAARRFRNHLIISNGNQTDKIYDYLRQNKSFRAALDIETFEPDAPNFTPRISALVTFDNDDFSYEMSILKCIDDKGVNCGRFLFEYPAVSGSGHLLHTYTSDGDPLPSFEGEPIAVEICNDIDEFANTIWNALDPDNRVSLIVISGDLDDHELESRIINARTRA